jgi:glycosyltransferase involved in cell wall biosynthesis
MSTPCVTVIVPNYNHARFLPKRLESIFKQTYQDFDLILLDDCSTDESREILSQHANDPRVQIEFNQKNSGCPFKQWNKGVRLARGRYVWIAESDDYADERFLERLVSVLDSDAGVAIAYCRSWEIDDEGRIKAFVDTDGRYMDATRWSHDFALMDVAERKDFFRYTNPIANASAGVFRKEIYDRVGGADESFRVCGDWKLWASMAAAGTIAYVAEALNYYRFHEKSVRSKSEDDAKGIVETLRVVRMLKGEEQPAPLPLETFCEIASEVWVWALMNHRVPLGNKWQILRDVRAVDPHPLRRAVRPARKVVRLKMARVWRGLRPSADQRLAKG